MMFSTLTTPLKQVALNTRRLFRLAWETDKRTTLLYYLTAVISAFVPLSAGLTIKSLIDHLQIAQNALVPTVPVIVVIVLAVRYLIPLADAIIYWAINNSYLDYIFRNQLQNEISNRFHKKLAKLDMAYFEDPKVQDLMTKVRDTMQWKLPDYLRTFQFLVREMVAYTAAFIVLLPFGWWIPIIVTLSAIPRLYLQSKYGAIQWSMWGASAPQVKKLWYLNHLMQEPQTVRELRISGASSGLLEKFISIQKYLFGVNKKALDKYLIALTVPPVLEVVLLLIIAYFFLPDVTNGAITIGSFTLLVAMLEQLGTKSANASSNFAKIYESNLYADHYFDLLGLPLMLEQSNNPVSFKKIMPPIIEFKNVSFEYPGGHKALANVSFVIDPGESVAFVGHNGAGKTTIVKLLCRFYDVTSGEILVNNVNMKELDLQNWYKHLGTLFQEFVRYHFTVKENITLGAPEKNDAKLMMEAAKKAGAHEFIEKLPGKYEQILGKEFEDGEELSGGQWQKLAIARAFYEEPPVLILDEPTSAIDAEAEYEIFNNLEKQYKNKTLILVSHRFSTVRNANKIIVLENGQVIETGSHDELMKAKEKYAELFSIQAKRYQ